MEKKFFKDNLLWIIIIIIILLTIYYFCFCKNNDLNRKKLNRKHLISKKIYESPYEIQQPSSKKLQKKLNKIGKNIDSKYIIKLFFADWCPHCVEIKPIWYSLKDKYSNYLTFIEVDCTENSLDLPYISGYPTIAVFDGKDNFIDTYNGDRSNDSLEAYIKDNLLNN